MAKQIALGFTADQWRKVMATFPEDVTVAEYIEEILRDRVLQAGQNKAADEAGAAKIAELRAAGF